MQRLTGVLLALGAFGLDVARASGEYRAPPEQTASNAADGATEFCRPAVVQNIHPQVRERDLARMQEALPDATTILKDAPKSSV